MTVDADSVSVCNRGDHEYRARMIIGCDGANSIVARASGLRRGSIQSDYAIDMMEETPQQELTTAERDRMYIYYRIRSHYGYGYVFPKTAHLNVGVGFKLDYYLSHLRGEHYAHHQAFVDDLKSKQLLTGQSNRGNFPCVSAAYLRPSRPHFCRSSVAGGRCRRICECAHRRGHLLRDGERGVRRAGSARRDPRRQF